MGRTKHPIFEIADRQVDGEIHRKTSCKQRRPYLDDDNANAHADRSVLEDLDFIRDDLLASLQLSLSP